MSDKSIGMGAQVGMVMIRKELLLPEGLLPTSRSYTDNWTLVESLDGFAVDAKLRGAGWWFMFLGQSIHATCWGAGSVKGIYRAMKRILSSVDSQHFNSVEVTEVSRRHFLGIPYIAITAHPRHVQNNRVLETEIVRKHATGK
jgi:hypothetical protein